MEFEFEGRKFRATGELKDTDYGPENRVKFEELVDGKWKSRGSMQEAAGTKLMIRWFCEALKEG